MRNLPAYFTLLSLFIYLLMPPIATAQSADEPVARAILFYSPSCPHCHYVITEVLVPMVDDYGNQLQILGINTSQPEGGQLYQAVIEQYQIPRERQGVPTLIVGEVILVGSGEIPDQFPTLVREGLATGGIYWPDIPGLNQILLTEVEQQPSPAPTLQTTATSPATSLPQTIATPTPTLGPQATSTPTLTPTPAPAALVINDAALPPAEIEAPPPDPAGFTLAGLVLIGMVAALGYVALRLLTTRQRLFWLLDRNTATYAKSWAIPLLSLAGLAVAIYLAYVEITHVEAVCGPVGECNIVQSSPYAQILGIPIAVLGILNYLAVGVLWAQQKYSVDQTANASILGLLGLTIFGTLFSIYLTLLEIFVIHAVCAWCLSSAVITTILMLLVVVPVTGNPSPLRGFSTE